MELWARASLSVAYIVELQVPQTPPHGLDGMLSRLAKPKAALSPSTRGICPQEVELDLCSLHTMFSRFASAARRAGRQARQLSTTAAAGDGSGFLIAGGIGVAAIACMAPRADEGHGDAAPSIQADEASKKLLSVLAHGEELAKIAKVKATMPDNIARRGVETKRRWRADDCDSRAGHPEVRV